MKKRTYIYIVSALCAVFACACNMFESIDNMEPKGYLPENHLIVDAPSAKNAKMGVYAECRSERVSALYTLLDMATGTLAEAAIGDASNFVANNIKEKATTVEQVYSQLYAAVNTANYFLSNTEKAVPGLNQEMQKSYRGEVYFLRALSYFRLLRLFGEYWKIASPNGVVLYTEPYKSLEGKPRASVKDVYALIIEDLKKAESEIIPIDEQTGGPIPKNFASPLAAKALLAKVYLYQGNWSKAMEYSDATIQAAEEEGLMLEEMYENIFNIEKISPEIIITLKGTLKEQKSTIDGYHIQPGQKLTKLADEVNPDMGIINPTNNQISGYDARYATCLNGSTLNKFKAENIDGEGFQNGLIELRLGEMYLIRSEAAFRMGNIAQAQADLQIILDRATGYAPDYAANIPQNEFLERLFEQKILELFAEAGESYFSAQRRHFVDNIPLQNFFANANHYMLPIPYAAIQGNPALTQNPTYSK